MRRADFIKKKEVDEPWLKSLGKDAGDRVRSLGANVRDFRDSLGLPPSTGTERQEIFNAYMHDIGATMLRSKVDEDQEDKDAVERLKRKEFKLAQILRKKVKVTDFEDGGLSISIDQEWDTSTW